MRFLRVDALEQCPGRVAPSDPPGVSSQSGRFSRWSVEAPTRQMIEDTHPVLARAS